MAGRRGEGNVAWVSDAVTRRLVFLLPVALFAVLLVAFSIGLTHDPHLLPSALIDRPAPDFALPGLYESTAGLSRVDLGGGDLDQFLRIMVRAVP